MIIYSLLGQLLGNPNNITTPTWRIILDRNWLVTPVYISHLCHLEGEQPHLGDLPTMVISRLTIWDDPPSRHPVMFSDNKKGCSITSDNAFCLMRFLLNTFLFSVRILDPYIRGL